MEFINFKGKLYPEYQSKGNAAQWIMPFAKEWCQGEGYDIGCNRKEWAFPGAEMIDLTLDDDWSAYNLPNKKVDYIFSSHCLEHLDDWVGAINYWLSKLNDTGVLFLYLPHESQTYWHPLNNRKHLHSFNENTFIKFFEQLETSVHGFISGADLNNSFCVVMQKKKERIYVI